MNSISTNPAPANAECRCRLSDGRELTITASRRPRANRAEVKCTVPGEPVIAERMQEVVRLARHTEKRFDSRDQVVLSMDIPPHAAQRDWELAAVLADRLVRGAYQRSDAGPLFARGWSEHWHLGQISEGEAGGVPVAHLGALNGHANPASAVSSVRAWFPLHSGGVNDALAWVEVSVAPTEMDNSLFPADGAVHVGNSEEDTIAAPGVDAAVQMEIRQTLAGARHFDGKGQGRWRTVVRFGQPRFQGDSYQLALVMADRLARGREFVPRGRIIATGCSSAWHAGRVETVEGRESKLELILMQAVAGDRVLLPRDWQEVLPPGFAAGLRQRGASVACIDRIGMI